MNNSRWQGINPFLKIIYSCCCTCIQPVASDCCIMFHSMCLLHLTYLFPQWWTLDCLNSPLPQNMWWTSPMLPSIDLCKNLSEIHILTSKVLGHRVRYFNMTNITRLASRMAAPVCPLAVHGESEIRMSSPTLGIFQRSHFLPVC